MEHDGRSAPGPVVERAREGRPETGDVRPAVDRVDVVREREDVLRERVVVVERDLDGRRALALVHGDRSGVEDFLVAVEVTDEGDQAALEVERALAIRPFIDEADPEALVEVGRFAEALRDGLEAVFRALEHLVVRAEDRARPPSLPLRADLDHGRGRLAAHVLLGPDEPVPRRLDAEPLRERVHDAHPDAVQPARHLVPAAAELAARMEDRVDDLEGVLDRKSTRLNSSHANISYA